MTVNIFQSFDDFRDHCLEFAEDIFVRPQINGKWGTHSLASLPPEEQQRCILNWWTRRHVPVRAKRGSEE